MAGMDYLFPNRRPLLLEDSDNRGKASLPWLSGAMLNFDSNGLDEAGI